MLTPETVTRHELIGLPVRVVDAASDDFVGLAGRVVGESMRTLSVRTPSGDRRVPKRGATFEFELVETPSVTVQNTEPRDGVQTPSLTDEAAGDSEVPGSASELGSDTAGVRPRQSGPSDDDAERGVPSASRSGECDGAGYVTVDGNRLLSRPAERTERGVQTWR